MFDRPLCTEAGNSKNYCATNSGSHEVELISVHGTYCSNTEQGGLTWAIISVPIMCISNDGPRKFEGKSKDDCLTLSQPLGSLHWRYEYNSHYLALLWRIIINFATLFPQSRQPASWWNFQLLLYSKCTQPSVMNYVTQGRHGLQYSSKPLAFLWEWPSGRDLCCDGWSMPPSLPGRTNCPGLELLSCELLANPAVVADVLVLNVHKKPS